MAARADSSALSPEVVGNAFVEQYYCVLHQTPDMVHKFYQESSMMSRPDSSGAMTLETTINGINDKILSHDYKNFKVQIFSADVQASYNNGLMVLVTGCLIEKDKVRRKFSESFFLAPQDKGYFVLNDIFRFVDEMEEKRDLACVAINEENGPTAAFTADTEPTQISNLVLNHVNPVIEDANNRKEASHPLVNGQVSEAKKVILAYPPVVSSNNDAHPVKEAATSKTQEEALKSNNDAHPVKEAATSKTQEEALKKSFASVVHDLNKSNAPFNIIVRTPPIKPVEHSRGTAASKASAPTGNSSSERNNDHAAKGYSIFVGNLPDTATVDQLKIIFEQFGPIKPDGIQVRSQKQTGNSFGFVEFELNGSVESVLKASPISIGNRKASIEVKRGNSNGGRFPPSQGGYQDNFGRRGNFNEGRGYRRNEYEKRGEFSGRSRVYSGRTGEVNHRVPENGMKVARQGHSEDGIK